MRIGRPFRKARTYFESALKDANIVRFHWCDLRHTFASWLLRGSANVVVCQSKEQLTPKLTARQSMGEWWFPK
jgi:integrase